MPKSKNIWNDPSLVKTIKAGGVVVMPTDTLYGVVGEALNISVVNRIYSIRKRSPLKPCIVLIGDINELENFSIVLTKEQKNILKKYWSFNSTQDKPSPVSIILDCSNPEFVYLHRDTNTLAFRLPNSESLKKLLLETGPLIAPSANIEGKSPAINIDEAKKYFGNSVDFYLDNGEISGKLSKLIRLYKDGTMSIIRG